MNCEDGTIYQGTWAKGKFHGKGRYTWDQGEYEGAFENGAMQGFGYFLFRREPEFCYFEGLFTNGTRNGEGYETCIELDDHLNEEELKAAHNAGEGVLYNFYRGNFKNG